VGLVLLAYNSSIPVGTVLVDCKSIPDAGMATLTGDGYVIDARMKKLYGAYVFGANVSRAQVQNPEFQKIAYQELTALNKGAAAAYEENKFDYFGTAGRGLVLNETLIAQVIQSGAAAENDTIGLLVGDADPAPVNTPYFTIRFTMSTTLAPNAWTNCAITLDRQLAAGNYKIIGARLNTMGGILFRLRATGSSYAVGGLCVQTDQARDPAWQRKGGMGVWETFAQNLLPTIDVLSSSADTAQSGEFDIALA